MPTLQELLAQRDALDRDIAAARGRAKGEVISTILTLMEENDLTPDDLGYVQIRGAWQRPKFLNAETGETWHGIGRKPRWLNDKNQAKHRIR